MKSPFTAKVIGALISFLMLSGCNLPTPTPTPNIPGVMDVGVGLPEPDSTWYVGQDMQLQGYASISPGGPTINSFTFYADAQQIANVPAASGASTGYFYAVSRWMPTTAGEYHIRAGARSKSSLLGTSDSVRICVLDVVFPDMMYGSFNVQDMPIVGYTGPCEIPATTFSSPPPPVTLTTTAAPASLGIRTDACPSAGPATISFQASVTDPGNRVAFVIVDLFASYSDPASTQTVEERLGLVQTSASGTTKVFTGSTHDLSGDSQFQDAGTTYVATTIHWIAHALDRTGFILATDGPHDIPAGACNPPPTPLIPIPIAVATATPASALDCPPGTYFAPITHRCIAVQIQPTKKPGGGGEGSSCCSCSWYPDPGSCIAGGCSWGKFPGCH